MINFSKIHRNNFMYNSAIIVAYKLDSQYKDKILDA